jgi:hypothetical protein
VHPQKFGEAIYAPFYAFLLIFLIFLAEWKGFGEVALKEFDRYHISFDLSEFRRELALLW